MTNRLRSTMTVLGSWSASMPEVMTFVDSMVAHLEELGCSAVRVDGTVATGEFFCEFEIPADTDGEMALLRQGGIYTVLALKASSVAAPGWPDGDIVEGAIASVDIRELVLV